MNILLKRAYEPPSASDKTRVLVDRIWPRGISKENSKIDLWLKDVAPSTALRKWFGHDPKRWDEFRKKYRAELKDNTACDELKALARKGTVTLIYAAKDEQHNHAIVLKDFLGRSA